jgi:hypothetical protein
MVPASKRSVLYRHSARSRPSRAATFSVRSKCVVPAVARKGSASRSRSPCPGCFRAG